MGIWSHTHVYNSVQHITCIHAPEDTHHNAVYHMSNKINKHSNRCYLPLSAQQVHPRGACLQVVFARLAKELNFRSKCQECWLRAYKARYSASFTYWCFGHISHIGAFITYWLKMHECVTGQSSHTLNLSLTVSFNISATLCNSALGAWRGGSFELGKVLMLRVFECVLRICRAQIAWPHGLATGGNNTTQLPMPSHTLPHADLLLHISQHCCTCSRVFSPAA